MDRVPKRANRQGREGNPVLGGASHIRRHTNTAGCQETEKVMKVLFGLRPLSQLLFVFSPPPVLRRGDRQSRSL